MRFEYRRKMFFGCVALAIAASATARAPAAAADATVTLQCTGAKAMHNLVIGLENQPFPTGGTQADRSAPFPVASPNPDAVLKIVSVKVTIAIPQPAAGTAPDLEAECAKADNIFIALRVAARNVSSNPAFVVLNARVICDVYANAADVPDLADRLDNANVKLNSLNFQFFFNRTRHGEQGLSFLTTGAAGNPEFELQRQGEANTDHFVKNAQLGGCVTRINV